YDKELGNKETLNLTEDENELMVLVENMGRINYGPRIPHQHKGIKDGLYVNGALRSEFTHYPLPLNNPEKIKFELDYVENQPSFSQFELVIDEVADTFIDMTGWGKGVVYINGYNIGRYWEVGPQYKLYVPAPLLKEGQNEIIVFE